MVQRMRLLIYISGPSCVGKTTLAKQLLAARPGFVHVSGNKYWVATKCSDFGQKVLRTNRKIVRAVRGMVRDRLLLDWVPHGGEFRAALAAACSARRRRFVQIALTATDKVLQARKFKRDRSRDTHRHPTSGLAGIPDCTVIDTTRLRPAGVHAQAQRFLRRIGVRPWAGP